MNALAECCGSRLTLPQRTIDLMRPNPRNVVTVQMSAMSTSRHWCWVDDRTSAVASATICLTRSRSLLCRACGHRSANKTSSSLAWPVARSTPHTGQGSAQGCLQIKTDASGKVGFVGCCICSRTIASRALRRWRRGSFRVSARVVRTRRRPEAVSSGSLNNFPSLANCADIQRPLGRRRAAVTQPNRLTRRIKRRPKSPC